MDDLSRRTIKVHWPDVETSKEAFERAFTLRCVWIEDGYSQAIITFAGTCRIAVLPL